MSMTMMNLYLYPENNVNNEVDSAISAFLNMIDKRVIPVVAISGKNLPFVRFLSFAYESLPLNQMYDLMILSVDSIKSSFEKAMDICYVNASDKDAIREFDEKRMMESACPDEYRDFLIYSVNDQTLAAKELSSGKIEVNAEEAVNLMRVLKYSDDQINAELRKRSSDKASMYLLATRLDDEGKSDESIEVLKRILPMENGYFHYYREQAIAKLKEIYERLGMKEDLIDLLQYEIVSERQRSLDNIKRLKSLISPERWKRLYPELLTKNTLMEVLPAFLADNVDYPALMELAEKRKDVDVVYRYPKLFELYPERCLDMYEEELRGEESRWVKGFSRKYGYYVSRNDKLLRTEQGKPLAKAKLTEIPVKYRTRRSLVKELDRLRMRYDF